jgi:RNA polymerase sigma-70 factor (ECF subfamily)
MMLAVADPTVPTNRAREPELARDTLERCKAGDPMAFRAFVVRYQRPVFALISRLVGRGPHVEDLAQEVFLRAFRAFSSFDLDADAKPSTWILTIATRAALDARKRRTIPIESIAAASAALADGTPETERRRGEVGAAIARAVGALPDDQRAAFVLAELHGLTMAEIAAIFDVAENTIKTRLFRARSKLKEQLGALVEDV